MSVRDYSDVIFENYESYLKEHRDDISSPSGAIEMLTSDGAFRAYIDTLTEGLNPYTKNSIMGVCERQREMLIEESINLAPSANVIGFAVTHFPILADIYSDPILSQIATIYPVNKSIITIPKIKINASVKNSDGTTSEYRMPRSTNLIRGTSETISIAPNIANNLFALSTGGLVTVSNSTVNKRYFVCNNLKVTTGATVYDIPMGVRPDSRGQILFIGRFNLAAVAPAVGDEIEVTIIGNCNWDSGTVQFSGSFANKTNPAAPMGGYSVTQIDTNVVFSAITSDINRAKVGLKIQGWDVNIDVKDDFEIDLQTEVIQDYRDIYQLDLIRAYSMAIKTQILLNKDFDLAYYLRAAEPEMILNGSSVDFDLAAFLQGGSNISPNSYLDVFKGIIPKISIVNRNIRRVFRADPQFLIAGIKAASLLESLQKYSVIYPDVQTGQFGYEGAGSVDFRKQTVLYCDAIPEDKIYVVYRAPSDDLTRTAIVDLIYKPLYVIEEITNAIKKTFIRSRTALEITNPEALGVITIKNYQTFIN